MYLQVKGMKKSYGEGGSYIQVLKGISTGVEKGEIKMEIKKLIVLTCGEANRSFTQLSEDGIRQSEIVSIKIASMIGNEAAKIVIPNYGNEPIKHTARTIFLKVREKSSFFVPSYTSFGNETTNIWRILDTIYSDRQMINHQDYTVIVVMCSSSINRFMRYFCEDNGIIPFTSNQTPGHCCGYEIDCEHKKCNTFE